LPPLNQAGFLGSKCHKKYRCGRDSAVGAYKTSETFYLYLGSECIQRERKGEKRQKDTMRKKVEIKDEGKRAPADGSA